MITTLSEQMMARKSGLQQYEIIHHKLNNFIEKVNEKIIDRIQLVQHVYLDDYKEQVSIMAAQLKAIRGVLDQELLKQRSNERLFYLQQERDFFRAQVIKLNEDIRKTKDDNTGLKKQLAESQHEIQNYKTIAYELETKVYKLTYENVEMEKIRAGNLNSNYPSISCASMNATKVNMMASTNFATHPNDSFKAELGKTTNKLVTRNRNSANSQLSRTPSEKNNRKKLCQSVSLASMPKNTQFRIHRPQINEPSKPEQILDQCIKQVKKQIYYRNLKAKESQKIHFDESSKISFDKFTKSDRNELVRRFMSDPAVLEQLYSFVFEQQKKSKVMEQDVKRLERLALAKGIDSRFNARVLQNYRAEFAKKIYDIKSNRL